MVIIGVDQSLSNSALYEHRCLENVKKYTNGLEILLLTAVQDNY